MILEIYNRLKNVYHNKYGLTDLWSKVIESGKVKIKPKAFNKDQKRRYKIYRFINFLYDIKQLSNKNS